MAEFGFLSSQNREIYNGSYMPGPGSYEPDSYLQKINISSDFMSDRSHYINYSYGHLRRAPQPFFASNTPRFQSAPKANIGPGYYHLANIIKKTLECASPKKPMRPHQYKVPSFLKHISNPIGPGTYELNYNQVKKKTISAHILREQRCINKCAEIKNSKQNEKDKLNNVIYYSINKSRNGGNHSNFMSCSTKAPKYINRTELITRDHIKNTQQTRFGGKLDVGRNDSMRVKAVSTNIIPNKRTHSVSNTRHSIFNRLVPLIFHHHSKSTRNKDVNAMQVKKSPSYSTSTDPQNALHYKISEVKNNDNEIVYILVKNDK